MSTPAQAQNKTWIGASGSDWGTAGSWSPSGLPGASGTATFGSSGGTTVGNASPQQVENLTFSTNAQAFTIGSSSGGSLILLANGAITNTSTVAEAVNAPLVLEGSYSFTTGTNSTAGLTFGGSVTDSASSGTQLLTMNGTASGTTSGLISDGSNGGSLGIARSGKGAWILSDNSNSFSGPVTINSGTILATSIGNAGTVSALGTNGTITLGTQTTTTAAVLDYTGSGETSNKSIAINGKAVSIVASGTSGAALNLVGTLSFGATVSTNLILGGTSGATNTLAGNIANSTTTTGLLTSVTVNSSGGTWVLTGTNTYTGSTQVTSGSTLMIGNGGTSGTLGSGGGVSVSLATLIFNRSDALTVSNLISQDAMVVQAGAGITTLTAANNYSGVTELNAGELSVGTISPIGNNGTASNLGAAGSAAGNLVFNGGALQYTGVSASTDRGFTITEGSAAIFDITVNDLTLTGTNNGTTGAGLTKIGAGTLTLGDGTTDPTYYYQGATTVSSGTLVVNGSIAASSGVALAVGSSLGGIGTISSVTLAGGNTLFSAGTLTTGGITVSGTGNNLSAGTITGNTTIGSSAAFTIASGAALTGTAISAGLLTNNGAISSTVEIQSGGTLSGSGTFNGAVTIDSGGALSPGNNAGPTTFANSLTLNGATQLDINGTGRGTTYNALNVTGTLTYGGMLSLVFGSTVTAGQTYTLFTAASLTGDFSSISLSGSGYSGALAETGGVWTATDNGMNFTYTDATGELSTTLSAVPEPSTYGLIFGGLALGLAVYRRATAQAGSRG